MSKPREIKFKVLFGTDDTLKTDMVFVDNCSFMPGETFLMREISPNSNREELIKNLKSLAEDDDFERAHSLADNLIIEYIADAEISEAYEAIGKYYA